MLEKTGGNLDVILDDGSHIPEHQILTFNTLFPSVVPGGIYIIEDVNDIDSKKQNFINLHPNSEIIDNYEHILSPLIKCRLHSILFTF